MIYNFQWLNLKLFLDHKGSSLIKMLYSLWFNCEEVKLEIKLNKNDKFSTFSACIVHKAHTHHEVKPCVLNEKWKRGMETQAKLYRTKKCSQAHGWVKNINSFIDLIYFSIPIGLVRISWIGSFCWENSTSISACCMQTSKGTKKKRSENPTKLCITMQFMQVAM